MKEIFSASLYYKSKPLVELNLPKLRIDDGLIYLDCYIDKNFFEEDYGKFPLKENNYFKGKTFSIQANNHSGSKIIFNQVVIQSQSFPSYKFSFLCIDYYTEYLFGKEENIVNSKLQYFVVEGVDMQFTGTSETKKIRSMFGKDDSSMMSFELENSEIRFDYYGRKRRVHLEIGLLNNDEKDNSILVKFYQDDLIPFRVYKKFKHSLKYFISYLSGNNVVIREEYFFKDMEHYIRVYSQNELEDFKINYFLPINNIHFRHKRIIDDYVSTITNYLIWDRLINLSEIVYLINQSKKVNIESSFFILLIVIEKIANQLYNSSVIDKKKKSIISNEKFTELKESIFDILESDYKKEISKPQLIQLKSKIGNLNSTSKTDNKIDLLLEFCEINRNEEIDSLFPQLRNLAIHQGEISYDRKDSRKNYQTLYVLTNSIICNLLQYKGVRYIKTENDKTFISKKEEYKIDTQKL